MRLRLLALALAAQIASGCFVFDELDKGEKILDESSPTRNAAAKKKAEEAAAKAAPGQPADPNQKKKSWWETARTLSKADKAPSDDPHVRCRIEGRERFMLQSDCLTQGGKPSS
jgi:hypothetical protein